jgi:formylglycine-generating enzyme required for sulfatase activity
MTGLRSSASCGICFLRIVPVLALALGMVPQFRCTDNNSGPVRQQSSKAGYERTLPYLIPVDDSTMRIDTISNETGAVISWIPTTRWYMLAVYDSLDTVRPVIVVETDTNLFHFNRFRPGHVYMLKLYQSIDTVFYDSSHISPDIFTLALPFGDTVKCFTDTLVITYDTLFQPTDTNRDVRIPDSPYVIADNTMGYFLCKNPADSLVVLLDNRGLDPAYLFTPAGYAPVFKVRFSTHRSPGNVRVTVKSDSSLLVTWDPVAGNTVTGYRVYVLDSAGNEAGHIDSDSTSVTCALPARHGVYKISVATVSQTGVGPLDSTFAVDTADSASMTLPYTFISTLAKPADAGAMTGIKGGMFVMGEIRKTAKNDYGFGNRPAHEVCIPSFYLGRNEVTCGEFLLFLNAIKDSCVFTGSNLIYRGAPCADTAGATWYITYDSAAAVFALDTAYQDFPVLSLYWHGAAAYCNWRSVRDSLEVCYDTSWNLIRSRNGYRLPSEAEFEYAASAAWNGTKQRFPWGNSWVAGNVAAGKTRPERTGASGTFNGLSDLAGNAMEYVNDWNDPFTGIYQEGSVFYTECLNSGISVNPVVPKALSGKYHILRGGSFASAERECSAVSRFLNPPAKRLGEYGFRLARDAR